MGLIEFTENDVIITLRKDGKEPTTNEWLEEVYCEWGFPAQLIIRGGRDYIQDVVIRYEPDIGDFLSITFITTKETPPRTHAATPFYFLEKDAEGRVGAIRIPYISRWADPEIIEELQSYIVTYPPATETPAEETPTQETSTEETPMGEFQPTEGETVEGENLPEGEGVKLVLPQND